MTAIGEMIEQTSINHDKLLSKLTHPLSQHFGISYFCYQFVSNDGDWFTLANNPDWLLHSAEHKFFQFDPSLVRPQHYNTSSICFPKYHENDSFQQTLICDAVNLFDLDHTLALIEPNASGCEYYFFAAPKKHYKVLDIYLAQLPLLRRDYIRHIQSQIQPIYSHCLSHTVNLNEMNLKGFNSTDNILSIQENAKQEAAFLSAVKNIPALTQREYQCLQLYQLGLTAKQSAQKLKLSHRTIEDHFDNIKIKYGVNSKRDLLLEPVVNTVILTEQ